MRKNTWGKLIVLCFVFAFFTAALGTLAACDADLDIATKVVFSVDGREYEVVETVNGDIVAPIAPNVEGKRFEGWYFNDGGVNVAFSIAELKRRLGGETVYVYAVYGDVEKKAYVIFEVDGKEYKRSEINIYNGIEMPEKSPSKKGYEFVGWFYDTDGREPFDIEDIIAIDIDSDVTVYAVFEENEYEISYKVGGEIYRKYKYTVTTLDELTLPDPPKKSGYNFRSWQTSDGNEFEISKYISIGILENIEVDAVFDAIEYSIDLYNGDTLIKRITVIGDNGIELDDLDDIRGYNFAGWYVDKDAQEIFDADAYNSEVDKREIRISLYAKFLENVTTVTFINGDEIRKIEVKEDCFIEMPEEPSKKGFKFLRWYTIGENGERETFDGEAYAETISRRDICVYAEYEEITTRVTFFIEGEEYGSIDVGADKMGDADIPDPSSELSKDGYDFLGWYTDEDKTVEFDIESYQNDPRRKDISVYAKIAEKEYRIVYMVNGKVYESDTVKHRDEFLPIDNLNVVGYDFIDWYTDEEFNEIFSLEDFNAARRDITLYGKLDEKIYGVIFIAEGEEISKSNYLHYSGDIEFPIAPTLVGKTFSYWSEYEDGEVAFDKDAYFDGEERRDIVLYAVYSDICTSIFFNVGGETYREIKLKYKEELIEIPDAPSADGYDFLYWSISESENIAFDKEAFNSSVEREDIILYAVYEEKTYTIDFYIEDRHIGTTEYKYNDKNVELILPPELFGKEFLYWSYDVDGYSRFELNEYMAMSEKRSIFLYAQYADKYSSVVFKVDGKTYQETSVKYGDEVTLPVPEKEKYVFIGWYIDENFSEAFDIERFQAEPSDIILYARFKRDIVGENGEYDLGAYVLEYRGKEEDSVNIVGVKEKSGNEDEALETLVIPAKIEIDGEAYNVKEVETYAIVSLQYLKNLVLERGVVNVGMFFISDCPLLESVYLPRTIASASAMAFEGMQSSITVYIDGDEDSISAWDNDWNVVDTATGTKLNVSYGWQIVPTYREENFQLV